MKLEQSNSQLSSRLQLISPIYQTEQKQIETSRVVVRGLNRRRNKTKEFEQQTEQIEGWKIDKQLEEEEEKNEIKSRNIIKQHKSVDLKLKRSKNFRDEILRRY